MIGLFIQLMGMFLIGWVSGFAMGFQVWGVKRR